MKQLIRNILGISMIALLPATAMYAAETESFEYAIEQEMQTPSISVNGKTLTIKNAENTTLAIYSITGEEVFNKRIDSPGTTIDLNHLKAGCYIVKIGKTARKVYLK